MLTAIGDLHLFVDADGATEFSELGKLKNILTEKKLDIIVGSRNSEDSSI